MVGGVVDHPVSQLGGGGRCSSPQGGGRLAPLRPRSESCSEGLRSGREIGVTPFFNLGSGRGVPGPGGGVRQHPFCLSGAFSCILTVPFSFPGRSARGVWLYINSTFFASGPVGPGPLAVY